MTDTNIYKNLLAELDTGNRALIVTTLEDKKYGNESFTRKTLFLEKDLQAPGSKGNLEGDLYMYAQNAMTTGNLQFITEPNQKKYLFEPFSPQPNLIVFGGGHIAKPLVEFGARVGFAVTIVDDRLSFANKQRFPHAEKVICQSFEKCFGELEINRASFIVIVTRGHRHDLDCLRQVLKYNTAYVGMIGSRRRVKSAREQLAGDGYSQEILSKVNAPIGLDIGAVTPEEIAIAIIAQVISFRRANSNINGLSSNEKFNCTDLDRDVLAELAKEQNNPKAVITVVMSKGSVPRKPGAKMIVWPDGRIMGSIGGGCSEGEVISIARDMIRDGGYKMHCIDMTGQVSEDEGMVCGGIMEVIIEPII